MKRVYVEFDLSTITMVECADELERALGGDEI